MNTWSDLVKSTLALLAIVNPIGGIPTFLLATRGFNNRERARIARIVPTAVFCVLATAALFGTYILEFFGISIAAFRVGSGILLLMLAIAMLQARESPVRQTPEEARVVEDKAAVAIVPLSIPLLAGPGAISSVILAADALDKNLLGFVGLLAPVVIVAVLVWIAFVVAARLADRLGTIGINIITRLMGLMLAAVAVEFIAKGVGELFPKLVQ